MFSIRGNELGHPVFTVPTTILQGKTVELRYELTEPAVPGEARVPVQPLVDIPKVTVNVPNCGGVMRRALTTQRPMRLRATTTALRSKALKPSDR